MNEDCLFLNIFSPFLDKRAKLPVMVWIHGGAFQHGKIHKLISFIYILKIHISLR